MVAIFSPPVDLCFGEQLFQWAFRSCKGMGRWLVFIVLQPYTFAHIAQAQVGDRQAEAAYFWLWFLVAFFLGGLLCYLWIRPGRSKSDQVVNDGPDVDELIRELEEKNQMLSRSQHQLRQQERFVALGMLMAGIAHEVRNPLNFINNFADLTTEILADCRQIIADVTDRLTPEEKDEIEDLIKHLEDNAVRIQNHGGRANRIVSRVLVQSRDSEGHWQPTDINALVEEYADLCFHSIRARHPGQKHNLVKNLDATLPTVMVDPQDVSRALVNLMNNGYYAAEKQRDEMGQDFKPTVTVSSQKQGDFVVIGVADNGSGVPDGLKEKIFQPFFTTKPFGEGTGLGLALTREIMEAHHAHLEIHSQPEQGARFEIHLPIDPKKINQELAQV